MKRGNHFSEKGSDFKFLATANELQFDIRSEEWSNGGFRQAERKNIPPRLGLNPSQSIIDVFKRFCHFGLYYLKQFALLKGYCGSVGRAFASNTRGPQFEPSIWQTNLFTVSCLNDESNEKEARKGHFFKKLHVTKVKSFKNVCHALNGLFGLQFKLNFVKFIE